MIAALRWVDGSTPAYLIVLLVLTLGVVLWGAWIERPRDPWEQKARDDRRAGR